LETLLLHNRIQGPQIVPRYWIVKGMGDFQDVTNSRGSLAMYDSPGNERIAFCKYKYIFDEIGREQWKRRGSAFLQGVEIVLG
jgi:hypothetical protein